MSIEERFTQNLTDHFKENKKGLIPKCDYQKTIDDLKAAADNSHAKGKVKMSIEERFTQNLTDRFKENKKGLIPKCDYQKTIDDLKAAADNSHAKGRHGYYLLEKYEVLQCGPTEKLIKRRSTRQESPLYYVSIEETFDVVKSAHISTGHGGRDRMLKELQKKYANIPTKAVELFKSLCQECHKKRKRPMTKGVVVRPILTKEFSSRGQVCSVPEKQCSPFRDKVLSIFCNVWL
ncbi:uncharacterized protein LOC143036138 [Oratosquilla oratoria]|uniref:uncharacterized protein LOC143036138 n=1 Tax=Oratosquilla oratoria TaxID=337810 RepID=UPI003F76430C